MTNPVSVRSDEDLISATREGDDDAYAELYLRHRSVAKGVAMQIGASHDDADDFVAEAFAATLRKLRSGGGPEVFFRGYILGAVRNLANRNFGKAAKLELVSEYTGDAERSVDDDPAGRYESEIVRAAFESLPERAKMVLWLTEVEDKKPNEITELMGLNANAVAALAYRSRETLRQAYLQSHLQQTPEPGCRKYADQLGALIRQKLPANRSRQVQDHVRGCIYCTTALHDISDVNSSLRRVVGPGLIGTATAGLFPAALGAAPSALADPTGPAAAQAANPEAPGPAAEASGSGRRGWWIAAAAALVLLLSAGIWFGFRADAGFKEVGPEPSRSPSSPSPTASGSASPSTPPSPSSSTAPTPTASQPPQTSPVAPPPTPPAPPQAINTLTPSGSFSTDQFDPASSTLKIGLTPANDGPLRDVRVNLTLPAGMSFDYVDAGPNGWQCSGSGQSVNCSGSVDSTGPNYLRVGLQTAAAGNYPVQISASGAGWGPVSTSVSLNRN